MVYPVLNIVRFLQHSPAFPRSGKQVQETLVLCTLNYIVFQISASICEDWLCLCLLVAQVAGAHLVREMGVISPFLGAVGGKPHQIKKPE